MALHLDDMALAARLTREGKLDEATRVIQRALRGSPASPPPEAEPPPVAETARFPDTATSLAGRLQDDVTDTEFREVMGPREAAEAGQAAEEPVAPPAPEARAHEPPPQEAPAARPRPEPGMFTRHAFSFAGASWNYELFLPAAPQAGRPVVVLLHGCKQDAADFAQGTGMNPLAAQHGCIVVYPEQSRSANNMGCWNWFEPGHQERHRGEAGMIAALAQEVAARHGGDPLRIYVAGLSAGGAMATLTAQAHPDVFAAVGIHSGLPAVAAHDLVSAFSAMRKGQRKTPALHVQAAVPTIVFHGSADKTVHPSNGTQIERETVAAFQAAGVRLHRTQDRVQGASRAATRTHYTTPEGGVAVEVWTVAAGPHAWSGGDARGSFTDPQGPSASQAMLQFFLQQARQPGPSAA